MLQNKDLSKANAWLRAAPFIILFFSLVYGMVSEKMPDNEHRGFFFSQLGQWVRDFPQLWEFQIDSYALKHILPAAILHFLFKLLSINPTDNNIILGFIIEQSLCYAAIAFLWLKISNFLNLSIGAQVAGLTTLILNVIFKVTMFMPISRDVFPQVLSLLMLYGWLSRSYFVQSLSILALGFTSPQGLVTALILFVFQYKPELYKTDFKIPLWRKTSALYVVILLLAPISWFMYRYDPVFLEKYLLIVKPTTAPLGQFLALLFIGLLSYQTARRAPLTRFFLELDITALARIILSVAIVAIVNKSQIFFASHEELVSLTSPMVLSKLYFWINATYYPGLFFILLVVNFGPIILLAGHYLTNFLDILFKHGTALILIFVLTFFRTLEGEPRHLIDVMPILFPFLLQSIESFLNKRNITLLVITTLLFSRIWLNLNYDYPDLYFWYNYTCNFTGFVTQLILVAVTYFTFLTYFKLPATHQAVRD